MHRKPRFELLDDGDRCTRLEKNEIEFHIPEKEYSREEIKTFADQIGDQVRKQSQFKALRLTAAPRMAANPSAFTKRAKEILGPDKESHICCRVFAEHAYEKLLDCLNSPAFPEIFST